jgi:hypothetical protein
VAQWTDAGWGISCGWSQAVGSSALRTRLVAARRMSDFNSVVGAWVGQSSALESTRLRSG